MDLAALRHLTRTDDLHVCHRADGLLLVVGGMVRIQMAHVFGCARNSLHRWGERYLAERREELADRARPRSPPKLGAAAREC